MIIVKREGKYTLQNENGTVVPALILSTGDWVMQEHLARYQLDCFTSGNLDAYYGENLDKALAELD